MQNLKNLLKSKLKNAARIALLGVGSEFRCDDVAGMLVAKGISEKIERPDFKVFFGATAPENLTGEIKKFAPSHLLIVDAADIGQKKAKVAILCSEEISGATFSTHRLPVKLIASYLSKAISCDTTVLGIYPESFEFGKKPSPRVVEAADELVQLLEEVICKSLKVQPT